MITSSTPINETPEWRRHVERIQNRIKEDPNGTIAGYELNLRLMHTPEAAGRILLKLAFVIEGARGEARSQRRSRDLGSLHYAIMKAFEDEEKLRPAE